MPEDHAELEYAIMNKMQQETILEEVRFVLEELKKQEIPMYIMYMYNIWFYSLYFSNERTCYHTGRQTMPIRHSRNQAMPGHIKPVPYRHQFGRARLYAIPAIAISDIALPAISHRQLSNLLHNTSS